MRKDLQILEPSVNCSISNVCSSQLKSRLAASISVAENERIRCVNLCFSYQFSKIKQGLYVTVFPRPIFPLMRRAKPFKEIESFCADFVSQLVCFIMIVMNFTSRQYNGLHVVSKPRSFPRFLLLSLL